MARFYPGKSNIERTGTAHENTLVLSSSFPASHSSSSTTPEQDVIVTFVRGCAAYEVRRFWTGRDSLTFRPHLSAGFAVIREIVLQFAISSAISPVPPSAIPIMTCASWTHQSRISEFETSRPRSIRGWTWSWSCDGS